MKFQTTSSTFEVNIIGKAIRRIPDNISGCWKSYVSISKPRIGAPVLVVWSVDSFGNSTKATLTSPVMSYEY
jgi:hypothetical protein